MNTEIINDLDREELGKLISQGYTSGQLYCDNGKNINWELELNAWIDE